MQLPEKSPDEISGSATSDANGANANTPRSRADAVRQLLEGSPLIAELRRHHDVTVFTFDSTLAGPHWQFRTSDPREGSLTLVFQPEPMELRQWAVLDAQGRETRVTLTQIETGLALNARMFQFNHPQFFEPGGGAGR